MNHNENNFVFAELIWLNSTNQTFEYCQNLTSIIFSHLPLPPTCANHKTTNYEKYFSCIYQVVLNLIKSNQRKENIRISKNKKDYNFDDQLYDKINFCSYHVFDNIIQRMEAKNIIEVLPGYAGFPGTNTSGQQTKIKPTSTFLFWLGNVPLGNLQLTTAPSGNLLRLNIEDVKKKEETKKIWPRVKVKPIPIVYGKTEKIQRMRTQINKMNDYMKNIITTIDIDKPLQEKINNKCLDHWLTLLDSNIFLNEENDEVKSYKIPHKPIYRIFRCLKETSKMYRWNLHGRFYGDTVQILPRFLREEIKMDHKNCVELDFESLHPNMLYVKENALPPDYIYLYSNDEPQKRREAKLALLTAINYGGDNLFNVISSTFKKSLKYAKGDPRLSKKYITGLMNNLAERNEAIAKYFSSGVGIKLMNTDSQLALNLMQECFSNDIPVRCIHDSFLIQTEHQASLKVLMKKLFKQIMKTDFEIEVE